MRRSRLVPFLGPDVRPYLGQIVEHLRAGGLVAYPTETVYGFGSTLAESTVARLRALKGREPRKPFLLLVTDASMVGDLAWPRAAMRLAETLWPGPLTLVLLAPAGPYPPGVRDLRGTVAVRATSHREVRALLSELGAPITSTSANLPGGPPALSAQEAAEVVAALGGAREVWVLDGGPLPPSPPSTVLDCTVEPPVITRAGALSVEHIRAIIPEVHERADGREF